MLATLPPLKKRLATIVVVLFVVVELNKLITRYSLCTPRRTHFSVSVSLPLFFLLVSATISIAICPLWRLLIKVKV